MPPLDDKELGTLIRQARKSKNWSQGDFAQAIGYDQRVISSIERGLRSLEVKELPVFAEALGVPLFYFFGHMAASSELDAELLKHFHTLPNEAAQLGAVEILRILSQISSPLNPLS